MHRRLPLALATLALALAQTGCGAIAVIHDSIMGPISPAGRIEPVLRGEFEVGERGIAVDLSGDEPRLRAYPPDIGARMTGFQDAIKGLRFVIQGQSFVIHRVTRTDREIPSEALEQLRIGETSPAEAAVALGPPSVWLRRAAGDVMLWRAEYDRHVLIRLGLNAAAQFVPIPGVASLQLDLGFGAGDRNRLLLLFGRDGKLITATDSTGEVEQQRTADADEAWRERSP